MTYLYTKSRPQTEPPPWWQAFSCLDASTNANTLAGNNSPVFSTDVAFSSGGTITTSTTTTYTYASTNYANPHAVTQINPYTSTQATTTFAYDNNGNLTQSGTVSGTTTYAWDYRNRMTGTATSTQTGTTTYAYDHADQRVRKVFGNTTNTYINKLYDISTRVGTTSASTTDYIWVGDTMVAFVEGGGYATSTYFVHPDHLGSTNVVTNSSGIATQVVDYYPFGSKRITSGSDVSGREFIGQFFDEASALSYLNARYYDGSRGQFLSQDPVFLSIGMKFFDKQFLTDPQQLNSYSYARNNPLVFRDVSGQSGQSAALALPFLLVPGFGEVAFVAGGVTAAIVGGYYLGKYLSSAASNKEYVGVDSQPLRHMLFPTYDSSGNEPKGIDPKVPKWQKGIGVGLSILGIGTTVYCAFQGFSDCVEKIENGFSPNNNTTPGNSSGENNPSSQINYMHPNANVYASMSIQSRREAVASYNSTISPGFSAGSSSGNSLSGTQWVTPSGTVVTWEGQVVSGPVSK